MHNHEDEPQEIKTNPSHSIHIMAIYNRYATHNHNSKGLKYELTSQQSTTLNQTNDHLDVQCLQIRVTRHYLQTRASLHSQTRSKHISTQKKNKRS